MHTGSARVGWIRQSGPSLTRDIPAEKRSTCHLLTKKMFSYVHHYKLNLPRGAVCQQTHDSRIGSPTARHVSIRLKMIGRARLATQTYAEGFPWMFKREHIDRWRSDLLMMSCKIRYIFLRNGQMDLAELKSILSSCEYESNNSPGVVCSHFSWGAGCVYFRSIYYWSSNLHERKGQPLFPCKTRKNKKYKYWTLQNTRRVETVEVNQVYAFRGLYISLQAPRRKS